MANATTPVIQINEGNVGIGTPSPATKLDVDGVVTASEFSADVNNVSALRMKSTASTIGYGVTNADLVSWSLGGVHPSGYYFRTTGANPAMQIIANGNVGIGTTSPGYKLQVGDTGVGDGDIAMKANGSGVNAGAKLTFNMDVGGGNANSYIAQIVPISYDSLSSGTHNSLNFKVGTWNNNADAGVSRMTILSNGNIGIGTTDPGTARLAVIGGNVGIGTTSPTQKLQLGEVSSGGASTTPDTITLGRTFSSVAGQHLKLRIYEDAVNVGGLGVSSNKLDYAVWSTAADHVFYAGGNELMRIKGGGNVGIGTTSPGAKLQIGSATYAPNANLGNNLLQIKSPSGFAYLTIGNGDVANSTSYIGGASGFTVLGSVTDAGVMSEHARITSSGNVGIGTTSPATKLHTHGYTTIDGVDVVAAFSSDNTAKRVNIGYSTSGDYGFINAVHTGVAWKNLILGVSGGNVGIGTTSPGAKLDVSESVIVGSTSTASSSTNIENLLVVKGKNNYSDGVTWYGDYGQILLSATNNMTGSARQFLITNALNNNKFAIIRSIDFSTRPVTNSTSSGVDSGYADFVIDNSGNVGIGTTSPGTKLDVTGVITATGGTSTEWNTAYDNSITAAAVTGTTTKTLTLTQQDGGTVTANWSDETGSGITGSGTTNYIPKWSSSSALTDSPIIDSSGNIGINISSPAARLHIGTSSNSGSTTEEFRIQTGVSAGFGGNAVINLQTGNYGTSGIYMGDGGAINYSSQPGKIEWLDVSTLMQFTSSNAYAWNVSASTKMYMTSAGDVGIGTTTPAEKLEVVGNIKANNYINQRVAWNSTFSHTTGTGVWMYIPVAYITEQTADTYYLNWIAAYGGRVRKVVLRGAGTGPTQTATTTLFRVMVNGSTVYTTGTLTVTGTSPNKVVSYEFGDSDAVFSATDRVQVLFNSNGVWQNAAVGIIIEYTE